MCTLAILYRPENAWPLIVAGNRDEMNTRPWLPPARHWPGHPQIVAGIDEQAGGSWLGVNEQGLVVVILNRHGTLGAKSGFQSRGHLVTDALQFPTAQQAITQICQWNFSDYRGFNLFVGDAHAAFWIKHEDTQNKSRVNTIEPGVHMLCAGDLDDDTFPRIKIHLPKFKQATPPNPGKGEWTAWQELLASRDTGESADPLHAMVIDRADGFQTLCSHLIGIAKSSEQKPVFLFADGPPDSTPFQSVKV